MSICEQTLQTGGERKFESSDSADRTTMIPFLVSIALCLNVWPVLLLLSEFFSPYSLSFSLYSLIFLSIFSIPQSPCFCASLPLVTFLLYFSSYSSSLLKSFSVYFPPHSHSLSLLVPYISLRFIFFLFLWLSFCVHSVRNSNPPVVPHKHFFFRTPKKEL